MNNKLKISTLACATFICLAAVNSTPVMAQNVQEEGTTLETYNRAMFKFNYQFDKYVMKPIAKGYRAITNEPVRNRVSSALYNLEEPISFANNLLQGEVKDAGINLGRFVVNSTLGLAGMFDVAQKWGMPKKSAGFDETLATYCVKDGPFVILPFIGPSTPRSFTGMVADTFSSPFYWVTQDSSDNDVKYGVYYGVNALKYISMREGALDLLDDMERNSVDYYATMRSAYLQNREKLNKCYSNDSNPSYDFDFGVEEEDDTYQNMESNQ